MTRAPIARLYLTKLQRQMEPRVVGEFSEGAINLLTEKGYNTAYGARFLKRHIDEKVKLPITAMWKSASNFLVDVEEGETVVKPAAPSKPELN